MCLGGEDNPCAHRGERRLYDGEVCPEGAQGIAAGNGYKIVVRTHEIVRTCQWRGVIDAGHTEVVGIDYSGGIRIDSDAFEDRLRDIGRRKEEIGHACLDMIDFVERQADLRA